MKFGIVGAGRLARTHVRHLKNVGEFEYYVFDLNSDSTVSMANEIGGTPVSSFEALLSAVDAVLIVTPNDCHGDYAVEAIQQGKHVFVEKPIEVSTEKAKPLLDASANAKTVVASGHVLRHFAMFKSAHEIVKSGKLGRVASVRMTRGGRMPGGANGWFADHSRSGGVFIDLGVHDFDWLLWTIGTPTQITANSVGAKSGIGPDYGTATISFENGAIAHVESTWMDEADPHVAFEVCGSEGMIQYDSRQNNTLRIGVNGEQNFALEDDPFYLQMKDFVEACQGRENRTVSILEAFSALSLAEKALESAKAGALIKL